MALEVGVIIEGRVEGITNFGAVIDIGGGKTGLVHISEVAVAFVKDIRDFLKEGQTVRVKVMAVEPNGKIALSIKKAIMEEKPSRPQPSRSSVPMEYDWSKKRDTSGDSFEDKLLQFKHESDERMQSMKRGNEPRRTISRRGNN